jgi:hypothetical protein
LDAVAVGFCLPAVVAVFACGASDFLVLLVY